MQALRGAVGGLLATLPMSALMLGAHRRLPRREKYPLPPALIVDNALRKAGVPPSTLEPETRERAVWSAHLLYGAAAGAVYGALMPRPSRPARGAAFGLGVWLGSYLGWLPLTGLMPPAHREPARRNALMIAAHLVWGAALALSWKPRRLGRRARAPIH